MKMLVRARTFLDLKTIIENNVDSWAPLAAAGTALLSPQTRGGGLPGRPL